MFGAFSDKEYYKATLCRTLTSQRSPFGASLLVGSNGNGKPVILFPKKTGYDNVL